MKKIMNIITYGLILLLLPLYASGASTVLYFPADYSGNGNPANVTNRGEFVPICEVPDDIYSVRLEGLDMVRGFAGAATCAVTSVSNSFSEEAEYVFLVDDTTELSDYMKTQMRAKNALQTVNGRDVIRPSVINFPANGSRQGFKILVVGETAYTNASTDENGWFATINGRFAADQVIAGGSASGSEGEIWFAYHGMYFNKMGQWLENVSIDKIVEFIEQQAQKLQQAAESAGPAPSSTSSLPAPPPMPSRPLNDYMRYCHNNLVPLPPVWNPTSGTSQWQQRGTVPNPFAAPGLSRVEVWTYSSTSPQGICFALPRMSAGSTINNGIQALGIICQSEQSGKACFWDNVVRPTSSDTERRPVGRPKITGAATRNLDPVNMSDGFNLEENCTVCHRGSNAFLVQEGTPLETHSEVPDVRYAPLSGISDATNSASWANPVSSVHPQVEGASSSSQCTMCHDSSDNEFPELTAAYCTTVLGCSVGVNMPPSNPANWARRHLEEVTVLSSTCCTVHGVDLGLADASGNQLNPTGAACVSDSDGDGVRDALDQCPGTSSGDTVNAGGCATGQSPDARCSFPAAPSP